MCRVCLCPSLHIVSLQVIDIDTLVIEHPIEAIYREFLIDTIDGSLYIFLTLIEIVLINGADGFLL